MSRCPRVPQRVARSPRGLFHPTQEYSARHPGEIDGRSDLRAGHFGRFRRGGNGMTLTQWLLIALVIGVIAMYKSLSSRIASSAAEQNRQISALSERLSERLNRKLEALPTALPSRSAALNERPQEQLLGHLHLTESLSCGGSSSGWYESYWMPIPDKMRGYVRGHLLPFDDGDSERPLTCWQVTDSAGRVLHTVSVDVGKVEAEIQRRIQHQRQDRAEAQRKWQESEERERQEREAREAARRNAEERAREEGLRRKEEVERRVDEIVEEWKRAESARAAEAARNEEDFLRQEAERIPSEVWRKKALEAASVAFPVCRLRLTQCGYDIVL